MSYNPLNYCELVNGQYEVDPAVMFPATVSHIKECVKGDAQPVEIVSPGWEGRPDREPVADRFLREAERLPQGALDLALHPMRDLDVAMNPVDAKSRSIALALAESWFKRALALKVEPPIRVHIRRNPDYRR